ncbi:FKBP-type peptidyl-prolyl cis-trans isomerase [Moraxella ovis]|uniref:FKBP-type peptidyl-prolyl cis-trans isomerase n=1 Tax=Moraxella ovis TaxID=29433 RepID=UPI000D97A29A|nr:FKBP-type peptidyl-prolyl cis-trans isomerase [Moraxella ovis]SPX81625.1 Probable FKBP-type peptidyl-prolyl cis-trans isomerase fkpA precursor [Moraxella ovis]STZ05889.1 Probable FKBP-type peptidyl-prolyl cis-trans isomerase fkpA precursor [Moraxella ovis]
MKKHTLLAASMMAILALAGCNKKAETADAVADTKTAKKSTVVTDSSTEIQKISYIIGYEQGMNLKAMTEQTGEELDLEIFNKAIADAFNGKESALTDEQIQAVGKAYEERKVKEAADKATKNKAEGDKFLAENKTKEGVKTTASGLQYKVITEGTGKSPKATDTVIVHYEGKLISGKVFDSSYERGMPAQFAVNEVIKGWTEGLQLMKEGGKYEFYIPSELAYGEAGNPMIEPNSVLTFTVELLSEEQAKAALEQAQKQMAEAVAKTEAAGSTQAQPATENK